MLEQDTCFLAVQQGDYVLVQNQLHQRKYVGYVLKCISGSKEPKSWTLFQILDIDNGFVEIVHATDVLDIVMHSVKS